MSLPTYQESAGQTVQKKGNQVGSASEAALREQPPVLPSYLAAKLVELL